MMLMLGAETSPGYGEKKDGFKPFCLSPQVITDVPSKVLFSHIQPTPVTGLPNSKGHNKP